MFIVLLLISCNWLIIFVHAGIACRYCLSDFKSIKGELNLDNKWQSDDLFYIIMNEIHPRFNQFLVILKIS